MHCQYCLGTDYEIMEATEDQARVTCVWCGKDTHWVEYSGAQEVKDESLFRFKYGRYQGMTIKGVKKILNNKEPLKLDEMADNSIRADNLKNKLNKISNIVKSLKKFK